MTYEWDPNSTYVQNPPYFEGMEKAAEGGRGHRRRAHPRPVRRLDHHRPHLAGRQHPGELRRPANTSSSHGVEVADFNQYGTRRGNHEVMMRGTFANIRIKNQMVKDDAGNVVEGGYTLHSARRRADVHLRRRHALQGGGRAAGGAAPARNTAPAPRATGRPRAPTCSASAPSSPRASSASTARTWSAWASRRSCSRATRRWASLGLKGDETVTIRGLAGDLKPRQRLDRRDPSPRTARCRRFRSSAGSIRSTRSSISATAASCTTSCASSQRDRLAGYARRNEREEAHDD